MIFCLSAGLLAAGCPKGKTDYSQGRKAEHLQDYDAAYDYYQKALKHDPENAEYLIKFNQARFEASSLHVKNGVKLRDRGQLEAAALGISSARGSHRSLQPDCRAGIAQKRYSQSKRRTGPTTPPPSPQR